MLKNRSEKRPRRTARHYGHLLRSSLAPREKKALLFIAGLFAFGAVVRWIRCGWAL